MTPELKRRVASFAVVLALSVAPLFSQTFGEITGHLSDTAGASVPATQITLTNIATNAVRTTASTDSGDYTFAAVAPGSYNIRFEHAGFKTGTVTNFQVQVQQTIRLDFVLQVGQITESIEVVASAEMLQTENLSLGTVIENKSIAELPLNGRNYLGLVALSANTNTLSASSGQAGGRQGGDRASQSISAGGNRIMFVHFSLDGVTNTDPNFSTYVALPSIDAIQEFKVQTGVYPAEFGHQATQVNVLTKSGGNAYHGALFEFIRNDKFDAKPYSFTSAHVNKSPFKWNDYGFEIDGPGAHPQGVRRPQPPVLHGQRRVEGPTPEQPGDVFRAHRRHVRRRLQRHLQHRLRPHHQNAVPQQHHPRQPHRSDLEEVSQLLRPLESSGPDQ